MTSNTEKYKKIIIPIIDAHLPKAKIILYGSRARGDDKEGSDIDAAIDIGSKIHGRLMTAIIVDIEDSSLPIKFDIVDFNNLSAAMQKNILRDGVVWKK